jgi:hypothetical protein
MNMVMVKASSQCLNAIREYMAAQHNTRLSKFFVVGVNKILNEGIEKRMDNLVKLMNKIRLLAAVRPQDVSAIAPLVNLINLKEGDSNCKRKRRFKTYLSFLVIFKN